MATIVCQNPQSCLDSNLTESRTLRLKLSSPKPLLSSQSLELAIKSCFLPPKAPEKPELVPGGWSCLEFPIEKPKSKEEVYVHPLLKRRLSPHSLEMCTENLGSETGSDDGDFSMPCSSDYHPRKQRSVSVSGAPGRELPPPLTTISGSESVRIQTRREGGRIVMEAVRGPYNQTSFRSERSHGRLRLYICSNPAPTPRLASQETRKERIDRENDGIECERGDSEIDPRRENENESENLGSEAAERVEEEMGVSGNNLKVIRGKMGNVTTRRCKEGCEKWEASCRVVTTS